MPEPFFPPGSGRVFAIAPGVDYIAAFVKGLRARMYGRPPEAMARVRIFVNADQTRRRLLDTLVRGQPGFLPRITVFDDLAQAPLAGHAIPAPTSALRHRLELGRAVSLLLDRQGSLARKAATFELSDSLASLMDEMHDQGLSPDVLTNIDVSDHAEHWERSLRFLNILRPYFADLSEPSLRARLSLVVDALLQDWQTRPPEDPVLIVGSTGSRGAMARLMRGVVALPSGGVILPGFDFDLPESAIARLDGEGGADHPQTTLFQTLAGLGACWGDVLPWSDAPPAVTPRNRLVSLALRPAPITDQWLTEGPSLGDLDKATAGLTLIEADQPRTEALAVALRLRKAAQDGQRAVLISPDRRLTRQVSAALARWDILPDDSAGHPLPLTPPGTFLLMIAMLMGERVESEALLALLKHPLAHSGGDGRNQHLLRSRALELQLLRGGPPFVDFDAIADWAAARKDDPAAGEWAAWIRNTLSPLGKIGAQPLAQQLATLRKAAESMAAGPSGGAGALWDKAAGEQAAQVIGELESCADAGGEMAPDAFVSLLRLELDGKVVRETVTAHPLVAIWGPREARLIDADLVILAGLNEGVWPSMPPPDPWMSRAMRAQAGLVLPERRIGLSALDFQMAVCAGEVVLSRASRDAEAPTVASRWLIRLANLLSGLEAGRPCLERMRARGQLWIDRARVLESPRISLAPARRPAPRPPVAARPRRLSVTRIKTLIRDPYAIYARDILRLRPLDALRARPDALMRGTALHLVLQRFVERTREGLPDNAEDLLLNLAEEVFAAEVPWPSTRRLWLARLEAIAKWLVETEHARRRDAMPLALECRGRLELTDPPFLLTGTADRIDRRTEGGLVIYDYKSGKVPTLAQVETFDKQLPLEAAMAEAGGFEHVPAERTVGLQYVGLGSTPRIVDIPLDGDLVGETLTGLRRLLGAYGRRETGYAARARMELRTDQSDYDHLSRRGEWDDGDPTNPEDVE